MSVFVYMTLLILKEFVEFHETEGTRAIWGHATS